MKNLVFFYFLLFSFALFSQNKSFLMSIQADYYKDYWNDMNYSQVIPYRSNFHSANTQVFYFGKYNFGIIWIKNRFFHKFEFMPVYFNHKKYETYYFDTVNQQVYNLENRIFWHIESSLSYTINYSFFKTTKKYMPLLGLGLLGNIQNDKYWPRDSYILPRNYFLAGIGLKVDIALKHNINDQMFVIFDIPCSIFTLNVIKEKKYNPLLTKEERTTITYGVDFLPENYSFSIGIGYVLK